MTAAVKGVGFDNFVRKRLLDCCSAVEALSISALGHLAECEVDSSLGRAIYRLGVACSSVFDGGDFFSWRCVLDSLDEDFNWVFFGFLFDDFKGLENDAGGVRSFSRHVS